MKELLKNEILKQLSLIKQENIEDGYDKIKEILFKYRDKGMLKEDAHEVILHISKMNNLTESQEEVIIEIDCRMSGFTNPLNYISW